MDINTNGMTGVMPELRTVTCTFNHGTCGAIDLMTGNAGADGINGRLLCRQNDLVHRIERVLLRRRVLPGDKKGPCHIRAIPLVLGAEIKGDHLARHNHFVRGFAVGQRTARPAGDNGVERGLVRTLLLHKPLQLGSDFTLAHTGLNETPDVLCGAVGNAARCTDTVDFVSGFYLPQRV